jgi:hypothetical protein
VIFVVVTCWAFFRKRAKSVLGRFCKLLNSRENLGAGDGDRTRDVQLGKLAFYR